MLQIIWGHKSITSLQDIAIQLVWMFLMGGVLWWGFPKFWIVSKGCSSYKGIPTLPLVGPRIQVLLLGNWHILLGSLDSCGVLWMSLLVMSREKLICMKIKFLMEASDRSDMFVHSFVTVMIGAFRGKEFIVFLLCLGFG